MDFRFLYTKRGKVIAGIVAILVILFLWQQFSNQPNLNTVLPMQEIGAPGLVTKQVVPGVEPGSPRNVPGTAEMQIEALSNDIAQEDSDVPSPDRKVVRSGSLSIEVDKTDDTAQEISTVAEQAGGYVEDLRIYEVSQNRKSGTVTIRVPSGKFLEIFTAIKNLAIDVNNEVISTQDITDQYVDLEARLSNKRAEEEQYKQILEQAFKIDDILNVTQHLSNTREQIERLEAQLKTLSLEVEMSSIQVNLSAEGDIEVWGISWRPSAVVRQSFRAMLDSLTSYVDSLIRFFFRLPVVILWVVTLGIGIWIVLRIGRRLLPIFKKPNSTDQQ